MLGSTYMSVQSSRWGSAARPGRRQPRRPARRPRRRDRRRAGLAEHEADLRELGVSELLRRDEDLAVAARDQHPDGFDAVLALVNYAPDVPASLVKEGGRLASPTGSRRRRPRADDDHGRADARQPRAPARPRDATRGHPGHLRTGTGARRAHRARGGAHPMHARDPDRVTAEPRTDVKNAPTRGDSYERTAAPDDRGARALVFAGAPRDTVAPARAVSASAPHSEG